MKKRLHIYAFLFLILSAVAVSIVFPDKFYKENSRISDFSDTTKEIGSKLISLPNLINLNDSGFILSVDEVLLWTNNERVGYGISPFKLNEELNQIAEMRLEDMAQKQYFAHNSPSGRSATEEAETINFEFITIGENIALGNFKDDKALVKAWMDSPGHRENILSGKYTQIGVAVEKINFEGKNTWLAVQIFARPSSDCPSPDSLQKTIIENQKAELSKMILKTNLLLEEMTKDKNTGDIATYNQKIPAYNSLVKEINQKSEWLTNSISQYNLKVNSFNLCIA